MNRTLTLPDVIAGPPLQRAQFVVTLILMGAPHAAKTRWISGDLTDFSSTNGALYAVKGLKSSMNRTLTPPSDVASPPKQRAQFVLAFISHESNPRRRIEVKFQETRPIFPPQTGPCARPNGPTHVM